jgi:hypothetical protein
VGVLRRGVRSTEATFEGKLIAKVAKVGTHKLTAVVGVPPHRLIGITWKMGSKFMEEGF